MNVSSIRTMKANNKNIVNINQTLGNNVSMSLFFSSPLSATAKATNISGLTASSEIKRGVVEGKHAVAAKREMTWTKAYIGPSSASSNNNNKTPVVMASTATVSEGLLTAYDTNADKELNVVDDKWNSKTMWQRRSYEAVKMDLCPSQQTVAAHGGTNVAFPPTTSSLPGTVYQYEHHHEQHQKQPTAANRTSSFNIPRRQRRQSGYSREHRFSQQQKYPKYPNYPNYPKKRATCIDDDEEDESPRTLPLRHSLMDREVRNWKATDDDNDDDASGKKRATCIDDDDEEDESPRQLPLRYSLMDREVRSWKATDDDDATRKLSYRHMPCRLMDRVVRRWQSQRIPSNVDPTTDINSIAVARSTPEQQQSTSSSRKRKAKVQLHKEDTAKEDADDEQLQHNGEDTMSCSSCSSKKRKIEHPSLRR